MDRQRKLVQPTLPYGWLKALIFGVAAIGIAASVGSPATAGAARMTVAALWRMPDDFLGEMHAQCDGGPGAAFADCFVAQMARAGASPAAIAFARQLNGDGYLAALSDTRPVAAGLVVYPFRANENDAWVLLDGMPPLIDVDDQRRLAVDAMKTAAGYRALLARYPNLSLWPGARGAPLPRPQRLASGGLRFRIDYQLHDLCHACAIVGSARFAFDFDHTGKFRGTRLLSVAPAAH